MIQDIAPHKYDVTYKNIRAADGDIIFIYQGSSLLCCMEDDGVVYPHAGDIAGIVPQIKETARFLFRIDDIGFFELCGPAIKAFGRWEYVHKEKIRAFKPVWKAFAAITGFQMHEWYVNTQFCGTCGHKMEEQGAERAMKCSFCGKVRYPQICPSVIVGVTNGDQLLMTKYAASHSKYRRYALIAGYAETGESLEDTVRREVMEEVGLKVKNLRYYGSQPWSYTDTLLVGFFCEADGDTSITMDESELSVAEWIDREAIPPESADDTISLTGAMMKAFKEGVV